MKKLLIICLLSSCMSTDVQVLSTCWLDECMPICTGQNGSFTLVSVPTGSKYTQSDLDSCKQISDSCVSGQYIFECIVPSYCCPDTSVLTINYDGPCCDLELLCYSAYNVTTNDGGCNAVWQQGIEPQCTVLDTICCGGGDNVCLAAYDPFMSPPTTWTINWSGPNGFTASGQFVNINNIDCDQIGTYTAVVQDGGCIDSISYVIENRTENCCAEDTLSWVKNDAEFIFNCTTSINEQNYGIDNNFAVRCSECCDEVEITSTRTVEIFNVTQGIVVFSGSTSTQTRDCTDSGIPSIHQDWRTQVCEFFKDGTLVLGDDVRVSSLIEILSVDANCTSALPSEFRDTVFSVVTQDHIDCCGECVESNIEYTSPPLANDWTNQQSTCSTCFTGDQEACFTITSITQDVNIFFGLNNDCPTLGWPTIDYTFLISGTFIIIYESGSLVSFQGTISAGDELCIRVTGSTVEYLINNVVVETSTYNNLCLYVDDAALGGGWTGEINVDIEHCEL